MTSPSLAQQTNSLADGAFAFPVLETRTRDLDAASRFGPPSGRSTLVMNIDLVFAINWDFLEGPAISFRRAALSSYGLNERHDGGVRNVVAHPMMFETTLAQGDETKDLLGGDVGIGLAERFGLGLSYETIVGFDDYDQRSIIGRAFLRF
jgi:hypothetical protein